jgi:hypothetical protein
MATAIPAKIMIITGLLGLAMASASFAKESGGGGSKASAGLEAGYHPFSQSWVPGEKDQANYISRGAGWLFYLTSHEGPKSALSFSVPTFAIWGDVLENTYVETDPSGAKSKEVIKSQGLGLGYVGHDPTTRIALSVLIGVERMYIDQSGDTPRSQKYPYGFSSRLGLGYRAIAGTFAVDLKVDWRFKHFPSTKSGSDSLKALRQQSFSPVIGISFNK